MKAHSDDHTVHNGNGIVRAEHLVSRGLLADQSLQPALRVEVLAAPNQKPSPAFGKSPDAGRLLPGELHFLEHLQAVEARQPLPFRRSQQSREPDGTVRRGMLGDRPIDLRERLAPDVDRPLIGHVPFAASTELAREDFLRPPPHSVAQISAVDPEFVTVSVDAAHDDVDVRIVRVVVVHRGPNEATAPCPSPPGA